MKLKLLFLCSAVYMAVRNKEKNKKSGTVRSIFKIAIVLTIECSVPTSS